MSEIIKLKDFKSVEVTGTTHGTADTQRLFRHGQNALPYAWFVLEGDVYIPRRGVGMNDVDVRSRLTSHEFRILFLF